MTDNTQEGGKQKYHNSNLWFLIGIIIGVLGGGGWWLIIYACRLKPDICPLPFLFQ